MKIVTSFPFCFWRHMDPLESKFKRELTQDIKKLFPECIIIITDPNAIQGFPDRIIIFNDRWAALEVKRSGSAEIQPNQAYWIGVLNQMSYASFVYPENKEQVLYELQQAFGSRGRARILIRK